MMIDLFDKGSSITWAGQPVALLSPIGVDVTLKLGQMRGKGITEVRQTWDSDKLAYSTDITRSSVRSVTIDVESTNENNQATDILEELVLRLRWPSSIARIQCMGLTTVHIGDVMPSIRDDGDGHECWGAVVEILFGHRVTSHVSDDDGNIITTIDPPTFTPSS